MQAPTAPASPPRWRFHSALASMAIAITLSPAALADNLTGCGNEALCGQDHRTLAQGLSYTHDVSLEPLSC